MFKSVMGWVFGAASVALASVLVLGRLGLYEKFASYISIGCDDSLQVMLENEAEECTAPAMALVLDDFVVYYAGGVLVLALILIVLAFGGSRHHAK